MRRKLRQELSDVNADMNETNKTLDELRQIQSVKYKEPQLNYFYKPSDEMKEYQHITAGVIGNSSGYLLFKYL